jgi:hypothetical protein
MLISLLITLIIIAVIFYILQLIPLPAPWKNIILLVFGVIVLIYLLRLLLGSGFGSGFGPHGV